MTLYLLPTLIPDLLIKHPASSAFFRLVIIFLVPRCEYLEGCTVSGYGRKVTGTFEQQRQKTNKQSCKLRKTKRDEGASPVKW